MNFTANSFKWLPLLALSLMLSLLTMKYNTLIELLKQAQINSLKLHSNYNALLKRAKDTYDITPVITDCNASTFSHCSYTVSAGSTYTITIFSTQLAQSVNQSLEQLSTKRFQLQQLRIDSESEQIHMQLIGGKK